MQVVEQLCGEFEREVLQMTQDLGTGEVPYDTSDMRHDVGDGGHRQQHHSLNTADSAIAA